MFEETFLRSEGGCFEIKNKIGNCCFGSGFEWTLLLEEGWSRYFHWEEGQVGISRSTGGSREIVTETRVDRNFHWEEGQVGISRGVGSREDILTETRVERAFP